MTNKEIISEVNKGFANGDTEKIMQYVADDVRWDIYGMSAPAIGKDAFRKEIDDGNFVGLPTIAIKNQIAEGDLVAIEGTVKCEKKKGGILDAFFFDLYRFEQGKIKEMHTYLVEKK